MRIEGIRRVIRSALGYNTRLYGAGASALDLLSVWSKEGLKTYSLLRRLRTGSPGPSAAVPVTLRNIRFPILVRPGTEDVATVVNNIIREEYGDFQSPADPGFMIDAGANIGDTAAYFLSRFPRLKVIALEPDPSNYALACDNLRPYGERAVLLQKALCGTDQQLRFGGDSTGASVRAEGFAVEGVSIPTLLKEYLIPRVSILKLDIEGAEELVFSSSPETWLSAVDLLIIEIHGPSNLELVSRALQRNGFSMRRFRSVWYCQPTSR